MLPYLPARWALTTADAIDDPTIFPLLVGQSFLTGKAPIWSTSIATSASGRERRQQRWSYPRWQIKCAYEVIFDEPSLPELQKMFAFFNMQAGRAGEFGFLDPGDNSADNEVFATGDGATTTFQIKRTTTFGGISFTEPVLHVVGIPSFTVGGSAASATVGSYGQVSFASPPAFGAPIAWSGRFAFRVRFDMDQLDTVQIMRNLWSNSGITLLSVKR